MTVHHLTLLETIGNTLYATKYNTLWCADSGVCYEGRSISLWPNRKSLNCKILLPQLETMSIMINIYVNFTHC